MGHLTNEVAAEPARCSNGMPTWATGRGRRARDAEKLLSEIPMSVGRPDGKGAKQLRPTTRQLPTDEVRPACCARSKGVLINPTDPVLAGVMH